MQFQLMQQPRRVAGIEAVGMRGFDRAHAHHIADLLALRGDEWGAVADSSTASGQSDADTALLPETAGNAAIRQGCTANRRVMGT